MGGQKSKAPETDREEMVTGREGRKRKWCFWQREENTLVTEWEKVERVKEKVDYTSLHAQRWAISSQFCWFALSYVIVNGIFLGLVEKISKLKISPWPHLQLQKSYRCSDYIKPDSTSLYLTCAEQWPVGETNKYNFEELVLCLSISILCFMGNIVLFMPLHLFNTCSNFADHFI